MTDKMDPRVVFRALARERRQSADLPSVRELLAYRAGTLSYEQRERVEEAIAHHPELARWLLDLRAFEEISAPEGVPPLTEADMEQDWLALRRRIERQRVAEEVPLLDSRAPVAPLEGHFKKRAAQPVSWLRLAAAASIMLAVGLGGWVLSLRREARQPRAVGVVEIPAAAAVRGGPGASGSAKEVRLEAVLVLTLVESRSFASYRLEAVPPEPGDAKPIWSRSVERRADGSFSLLLPRGSLAGGLYRLRLYGISAGGPVHLADYPIRVVAP